MIACAVTTLRALRLPNVKVKLNSLGATGREARLPRPGCSTYLAPPIGALCAPTVRARYKDNPLRVLDCKVDRENPDFDPKRPSRSTT
ncbi:MAG: hypothetical protein MZU97_11765 [Bacillus subtilis]|nr:hypothetical protein [Bacillus subtilis]